MAERRQKRKIVDKLKNKYRLVILNDDTFEEKASFRLSRFNVYALVSSVVIFLVIVIFSLVIFTPIKEYIPGYGDVGLRKDLVEVKERADSLAKVVDDQHKWLSNFRNVLTGNVDTLEEEEESEGMQYDTITLDRIPLEDALLREEIEREENYALIFSGGNNKFNNTLSDLKLMPPLKGYVTQRFNIREKHLGIDLVAPEKEPIKATLDGMVIFAEWTLETGYVIGIQHDYDLVSFYKHNSVLLKKVGNFVKGGDAIAIIGTTGELSTGPHLHFELWHDGNPLDPEEYINF